MSPSPRSWEPIRTHPGVKLRCVWAILADVGAIWGHLAPILGGVLGDVGALFATVSNHTKLPIHVGIEMKDRSR